MIKVSAVSFDSKFNDIDFNIERMKSFIEKAKNAGSKIICFPELNVCGYNMQKPDEIALEMDNSYIETIRKISVDNNINVLAGIVEKEKNHMYITHVVFFENGKIDKYRKTHLGRHEKKYIKAGDELKVFNLEVDNKKVYFSIAICYDNHFSEAITSMALKGTHIVFSPHVSLMNAKRRIDIWQKYMCARAYDNRIYMLAVNAFGQKESKPFGGGIALWNPYGELEKYLDEEDEQIVHFDIDFEEIDRLRVQSKSMKNNYFLKDRRKEIYR